MATFELNKALRGWEIRLDGIFVTSDSGDLIGKRSAMRNPIFQKPCCDSSFRVGHASVTISGIPS